jgi:hypothetical protein
MTTHTAELAAQIAQTRAFIEADYTEVALIPRERQATASGGWSDGVRFDVVGFSSGRLYELKAFVSCSAPVSAVPSRG